MGFEYLLVKTITSNFTQIVKVKKRVAKDSELVTSREANA